MDKYPTISLRFDRRKTAVKGAKGTVEVQVCYKNKKLYVPTGVRVPSSSWREDRVVNSDNSTLYNKQISECLTRVNRYTSALWNDGRFSLGALKSALAQNPTSGESPVAWIRSRIDTRSMKEQTRKHHEALPKALAACGLFLSWADFTPHNIEAWDGWLRSRKVNEHPYSIGTVRNYHKRLKVYIHEAMRDGLLQVDPYNGFKVERPKAARRRYLTDEQREEFEQRPLSGALAHARDLFVFQCYTGLAYSDMASFDASRDLVTENGETFIVGARMKTGNNFRILLLDKARAILERYAYKLPMMTNQKYNYFLKIASEGIAEGLTSHVARHTFATWALRNNVPIEVISAMLAHSNINITQIYAEQQQEHVNEEYRKLNKL